MYPFRLFYKIVRKHPDTMNGENTDGDILPAITSSPDKKDPLTSCENSAALNNNSLALLSFDHPPATGDQKQQRAKKKRRLEVSAIDKKEMSRQLEELLCKFCEGSGFAGMQIIEDNTVMALCTPFMHRVHKLVKQSGDLVFVDSYGDLDEPNSCRVLMLVTYSCIGAVPLGCLVTTSETVPCLKAALDLYKQILPAGCFFDKEGPDMLFTNDNEAERQSLKSAFPESHLLICLSHILQASWSFVYDRKNGIKKDQRSILFSKIRVLLFSQTVEELEMNYTFVSDDALVKTYPLFVDYLRHIYNHRHDWSLVYRRHLTPNASDVSFFWESAMIVLKDPILSRTRTYNPLQVIDFMSRLDTYYERKLIDLANNRFDSVRLSRFLFIELPREAYTITQNSESEYEVHNDLKDTTYQTDITLGMCECRTGKSGAPCKHQLLVYRNFPVPVYDCVPPTTQAEKNLLFHLATGQELENDPSHDAIANSVHTAMHEPIATIHEVYPGDFFLDGCEALTAAGITHAGVLASHNPALTLHTNSLVQTSHILEQQHQNTSTPPDVVHNLMAIDPHPNVSLSHPMSDPTELNPHLSSVLPSSLSDPILESHSVSDLVDEICAKLKDRTSSAPQVFRPALGTFLKNLDGLSAESSLEYALYSFGKFSKSATVMFKRKVVDNKLVGLQSAGRKKPLKCTKPS